MVRCCCGGRRRSLTMGCESSRSVEVAATDNNKQHQQQQQNNHHHQEQKQQQQQQPRPGQQNHQPEEHPGTANLMGQRTNNQLLSDIQIDIIHSTWPLIAKDKTRHGISIFMDIFLVEPKIKVAFKFDGKTIDDALCNEQFRYHAANFMNHIDKTCGALDALSVGSTSYDCPVIRDLLLLGAHHATVKGFEFAHFNVFTKCLHLTWERILREEYTEEVRDTWSELFEFIITKLQEGFLLYYEAVEKDNRFNRMSESQEDADC